LIELVEVVEKKDRLLSFYRWLFFLYAFCSPVLVAVIQTLALDFPEVEYFFGTRYSLWPAILFIPMQTGLYAVLLGAMAMYFLSEGTIRIRHPLAKRLLLVAMTLATSFFWWIFLVLSQRSVTMEYLNAWNANGLHFLIFFTFPIYPIRVTTDGHFPIQATILAGLLGCVIVALCYLRTYRVITGRTRPANGSA